MKTVWTKKNEHLAAKKKLAKAAGLDRGLGPRYYLKPVYHPDQPVFFVAGWHHIETYRLTRETDRMVYGCSIYAHPDGDKFLGSEQRFRKEDVIQNTPEGKKQVWEKIWKLIDESAKHFEELNLWAEETFPEKYKPYPAK